MRNVKFRTCPTSVGASCLFHLIFKCWGSSRLSSLPSFPLIFSYGLKYHLDTWRQWHPTPVLLPGKSHGRRAWWAVVHGVAKSRTRLSDFTFTLDTWPANWNLQSRFFTWIPDCLLDISPPGYFKGISNSTRSLTSLHSTDTAQTPRHLPGHCLQPEPLQKSP